jgi:hypothetical protein
MTLHASDAAAIKWNAGELTAVEECSGIMWELENGEYLPYGSDLRRKRITGVYVADDVTLRVPFNTTAGSDYLLLNADYKAKTERAFRVEYDAAGTFYRQLNMTITKCNPIISNASGEVTMVEVTLVNTGTTKSEN